MYLRPRYFSMVFALAGDSTTTRVFLAGLRFVFVFRAGFLAGVVFAAAVFAVAVAKNITPSLPAGRRAARFLLCILSSPSEAG